MHAPHPDTFSAEPNDELSPEQQAAEELYMARANDATQEHRDPLEQVLADEERSKVQEILTRLYDENALDDRDVEILTKLFFEGKSYTQIAKEMGKSKDTIGQAGRRAFKIVNNVIAHDDYFRAA